MAARRGPRFSFFGVAWSIVLTARRNKMGCHDGLEVFDNPIDNGKTPKDPNFKVEDYQGEQYIHGMADSYRILSIEIDPIESFPERCGGRRLRRRRSGIRGRGNVPWGCAIRPAGDPCPGFHGSGRQHVSVR